MAQTPRLSAVARRTVVLRILALASLLFAASVKEAAAKLAQAAASYQDSPKDDQRCDNCSLFQQPSSCQLVDGTINSSGWCKFWIKKTI
jgi:High potential iron-sulfur protein